MNIAQILKDKGGDVISVRADEKLESVAGLLDAKRIGAVLAIDDNGGVVGVLSERDIIRRLARHGANALRMTVGDAMTRDVVTVGPEMAIEEAMSLMTDRRIRHLPVLEGEKVAGFVSIGDLVKWKIATTEAESEMMKSYLAGQV